MGTALSTEKRAVKQNAIALKIHLSHRVRIISSQKVSGKFNSFFINVLLNIPVQPNGIAKTISGRILNSTVYFNINILFIKKTYIYKNIFFLYP